MKYFLNCCVFIIFLSLTFSSCKNKNELATYFKNSRTGEIYTEKAYKALKKSFELKVSDNESKSYKEYILDEIIVKDSIIKTFKLNQVTRRKIKTSTNRVEEGVFSKVGNKISDEALETLNNEHYSFYKNENKPTLINVWYTTCKPCIEEIDELNELKEKYKNKINFVAVTFEDENELIPFLKRRPFNYEHVIKAKNFLENLEISTYPKNIFIDKNNKITKVQDGVINFKKFEKELISLL